MPKESLVYESVDGVLYPGSNHFDHALIIVNVETHSPTLASSQDCRKLRTLIQICAFRSFEF